MTKKKNSPPTTEEMRRYLRGDMSDDDSYDFEQAASRQPHTLQWLKTIAQQESATTEWESDLADIRSRWQQERPGARVVPVIWKRVAAVAAIAITAWAIYGYYADQQGNRLFTHWLATDESYLSIRGSDEYSPALQKAMDTYYAAQYADALPLFLQLRQQEPLNGIVLQFTALAAMHTNEMSTARQALAQMQALDPQYADHGAAYWYIALLDLRDNQRDSALRSLQWLIDHSQGQWTEKALQLRKQLEAER
ncbi:MAG: hypothetical protein R2795_17025 [Saprospiraceae bacterium]